MTDEIKPELKKPTFFYPLLFFMLSGGLGLLLRANAAFSLFNFKFTFLVQSHSHVTFLGWGFLATLVLLHHKIPIKFDSIYRFIWYGMISVIFAIYLAFIHVGYKLPSIILLVVFLLMSYVYLIRVYKDIKHLKTIYVTFVRWGIFYYFISSIAVWIIPVVLLKMGKQQLYHDLIYFYLHFLYNGYFTFVIIGLIVNEFYKKSLINKKYIKYAFLMLNVTCIPAYVLSLYWHTKEPVVIILGNMSAFLQMIASVYLILGLNVKELKHWRYLFRFILLIIVLKFTLQFLSSIPSLATKAIVYKPYFVIGYIHWVSIGFISLSLLWLYDFKQTIDVKWGFILIILGFIFTEAIMFYQGTALIYSFTILTTYNLLLFYASMLLFLGILIFSIRVLTESLYKTKD